MTIDKKMEDSKKRCHHRTASINNGREYYTKPGFLSHNDLMDKGYIFLYRQVFIISGSKPYSAYRRVPWIQILDHNQQN